MAHLNPPQGRRAVRRSILYDEGGAPAVEFALLAPILVFACLLTVDIGVAIAQRMEIDYSLRAAAAGAFADLGEDEVDELAEAIAAESFAIRSEDPDVIESSSATLAVEAELLYACPESMDTKVDLPPACADSAEPYKYYSLTAEKDYQGVFLNFPLEGAVLVQVE